MKKQTTKKGWLLGLLVGLVMLVGASPALAGYMFLGDFCDIDNPPPIMFVLDGQTLTIPGQFLTEIKHEFDEDSVYDWDDWDGKFQYVLLKQGNCGSGGYVQLFEFVAGFNPEDEEGYDGPTFDSTHVAFSDGDKVSHISGYNQVPIPGAVWLLGSGLSALLFTRRRNKK